MVFTTHAITGAAIASALPGHPVLGFAAGFVSHFLFDAIPHWDYHLNSYERDASNPMDSKIFFNKDFIKDLLKMGFDFVLGLTVAFFLFIFPNFNLSSILSGVIFWGMVGALLPDFLQLVYFEWKHEPVASLQRLHFWVHNKKRFDNRPILGITMQTILIASVVAIFKFAF